MLTTLQFLAAMAAPLPALGFPAPYSPACRPPVAAEKQTSEPSTSTWRLMPRQATFLENRGQWPKNIRFLGVRSGMLVRAECDALVLQLADPAGDSNIGVLARFELARPGTDVTPSGEHVLPGRHHFLIGNEPSQWTRDVRGFSVLRYRCVADGIDLVLRDEHGTLEYDLEVESGADLSALVIACRGVEGLDLAEDGSLLIRTALGTLKQTRPRSEELLPDGDRREIDVHFRIVDETHFGFESPGRDLTLALRVDPGLVWSTYLGSSGSLGGFETCTASAVDAAGNVTLTGWADGFDFPTTPGALVATPPGGSPLFVTKLDTTGNLVYSTTIGPHSGNAQGLSLALDALGRATVGGSLNVSPLFTSDFPTTPGAFDTVMSSANASGFALRLSETGSSLVFSTFIEGSGSGSRVYAVDVAQSGATLVGGFTGSAAFPVTPGAFDVSFNSSGSTDGFVLRLDPTGSFLEWSTFLGGSGLEEVTSLKIQPDGRVTAVGSTGSSDFPFTPAAFNQSVVGRGTFITRLAPQGNALIWSAFLGGTSAAVGTESTPNALALEPSGGVVVVGWTRDPTFPTTQGALFTAYPPGAAIHSYVARVNSTGTALAYSTLLSFAAVARDVVVDASGVATVCGYDLNTTMPTTPGAFDATPSTLGDGFITRINPIGTELYYSTKFGGPNDDSVDALSTIGPHRVAFSGRGGMGVPVTAGSFDQTFNGGNNDIVAGVLDLFLLGTRAQGQSTPSCLGDVTMNVTQMPSSGAPVFGFWCSGAPPNALGWLLLGRETQVPTVVHGASLWLDRTSRLLRIPVASNTEGFVEAPFSLSAVPPGQHFAAQFVFLNGGACPGMGPFSTSHALLIDVQ
ncbi:MAG: hypothetical protein JNL28_16630 [Planctomycetes bacterium]|nr:hypothetical protein [Planctomycetota bacterium]